MGVKASNRLPRAFTGTEPAKYFLLKIVVKGEDRIHCNLQVISNIWGEGYENDQPT